MNRVEYEITLRVKTQYGDPRAWLWSDLLEDEYAEVVSSRPTGRVFEETEDGELIDA